MKIKNYPYGKVTKTLRKAVTWLNNNKRRIVKELKRKEEIDFPSNLQYEFDYPSYWDMPKTISRRLSSDEVDWIQDEVGRWIA